MATEKRDDSMTDWLQLARDAYLSSTSFMDANYRKQWEENIRMFSNKHPSTSKYTSDAYKNRSRLFRPKSRSVVRKNEAVAATAFFSNMDVVSVAPVDPADEAQVISAHINKALLQYRLTETIPWFQTLIAAFQEAQVNGVVCSYQTWKYKERRVKKEQPVLDFQGQPFTDLDGQPLTETVETVEIEYDEPCVDLRPIENIRIDPAAKWFDPVGTSPYLIDTIPMYAHEIKELMQSDDPKTGRPKFKKLTDEEIRVAINATDDTTRAQRESNREDSLQGHKPITEYEVIWVHKNIVRRDGQDWLYYTLGTHELLTDPVPLKDVYFTGKRPYVMGCCVIEAHKLYPSSIVGLGADLQKEANEIVNQRLDNVKFVLNKRWIVKRGAEADLKSLVRNVPGSITLANNPASDIREVTFPDVTASSYAEQDRVNVDYDELVGNFSAGSVQTNRKLNETVGGLGLIASGANQMTEYLIRTFTETWVEPVLKQLVQLEQAYETDSTVLALAQQSAERYLRYGIDEVTDELLNQNLTVTVNVGIGATDPNLKLQKFLMAMNTYREFIASPLPGVKMDEVAKEIFGHLGYKDGSRFFDDQVDPAVAALQQQVQQLQAALESKQIEAQQKTEAELQKKQLDHMSRAELQDKQLEFDYNKLYLDSTQ